MHGDTRHMLGASRLARPLATKPTAFSARPWCVASRQLAKKAKGGKAKAERVRDGDDVAAEALLPIVYDELRSRAASYFRMQPANHTLQPTALVHEAYVKLIRSPSASWSDRSAFCALARRRCGRS